MRKLTLQLLTKLKQCLKEGRILLKISYPNNNSIVVEEWFKILQVMQSLQCLGSKFYKEQEQQQFIEFIQVDFFIN